MTSAYQREFSAPQPVALVPGRLRGYRRWGLDLTGELVSMNYRTIWTQPLTARCAAGYEHTPPGPDPCPCGIYACHNPHDPEIAGYMSLAFPLSVLIGVIEAWGTVEVGQRGFRAQHARVVAIHAKRPDFTDPGTLTGADPRFRSALAWHRIESLVLPDGTHISPARSGRDWLGDYAGIVATLRRNYPGAVIYADRAAMLADFPPVDVSDLLPPPDPVEVDEPCPICGAVDAAHNRWTHLRK